RLKIMSNLDIAERRLPQDGRIKLRYSAREIDFRVSVLPTIFGEKAVLRILDKDALQLDLTRLGFDPGALEQFEKAIHQPYGMVLITGPTGSGKMTTLYSAIHTIDSPEHNIMTAEDPVEYNLKGVNQVQINDGIGRTFASALRAFLRQDPDVILVGETRDLETAQISIRAALTGHLVFSTLHTNDSPSTVARLIDMGIPPFLVASSLLLVMAQRLGRKVCKDCKEPYEVDEDTLLPYGHVLTGVGRTQFYKGRGCATCSFTGMKGRVAIYEVMPVSQEIRVAGKLTSLTQFEVLAPQDTQRLAYSVLNEGQKQKFEEESELDLSFGIQGLARFRCNVYRQRGAVGTAIRVIPYKIRSFDELGLPKVVQELADRPKGLVLVTGPTGSGKSTTLAAMVDKINNERAEHIMTIEDPIEFVHPHKKCLVNQREVFADTQSFKNALKAILRQDPDVVLVGEMRDLETIAAAITIAETGHLTFGTL